MIKKLCSIILCTLCTLATLTACASYTKAAVKIGVSFQVGHASRWENEKTYMEDYAEELGVDIEVRLNKEDSQLSQEENCKEMIDEGIDVLILSCKDTVSISNILAYATAHHVKVISYARVIADDSINLFVGYDTEKIGQTLGQYLAEEVYKGDYIILRGDENDQNSVLLYQGAMREINAIKDHINIICDEAVAGWDPKIAKEIVREALAKNNNQVDAILAPNDKIAGACAEVLAELNITTPVKITGMDAELDAAKRILAGTQSVSIYMDLKLLAQTAVDDANSIANKKEANINSKYTVEDKQIDAHLINGYLVTNKNIDKLLIESGYFTKEQVYEQ